VRAGILGLTKTAPYGRKVTVETFKQGDLFGRPFVERTGPLSKRAGSGNLDSGVSGFSP
jgi:hypothetical protein